MPRLPISYVLPLRWTADDDLDDLTDYLRRLSDHVDVIVVDGSAQTLFERHASAWARWVRHLAPQPWPGGNGKVKGVVTGVRAARHEKVVIADDDVRWTRAGLVRAAALLDAADLVRPQNVFSPLPWHARWDTGRSLINRALGGDYPGTYAVRRSTFVEMGGYAGDVLFENLEMARTVRAAGGRELVARSLLVRRRPPTTGHFLRQRTRQAYDDLAQPARLVIEAAVLPTAAIALLAARRSRRAARGAAIVLGALLAGPVLLAEIGRRVAGGRTAFPPTSSVWAPLWLAERAVCVWIALLHRLRGGVPYSDGRLAVAAHSERALRRARRK